MEEDKEQGEDKPKPDGWHKEGDIKEFWWDGELIWWIVEG